MGIEFGPGHDDPAGEFENQVQRHAGDSQNNQAHDDDVAQRNLAASQIIQPIPAVAATISAATRTVYMNPRKSACR